MFDSPLAWFAFAIAPIVTVVFASSYWLKRDPASDPSIVAAIPLCLSSVAILLAHSSTTLLAAFSQIASRRSAGIGAVIAGLRQAQGPLAWGLVECTACLVLLFLLSAFLRFSRDAETPLIHAYISLPALITTAVFLISFFLLVYLQYRTVDLVMMIVDTHRLNELGAQYGSVNPGFFAARISSSLVSIFFLSIFQTAALIVAGILDLFWRQKQNGRQAFAAALIIGALICSGVGALNDFGFLDYLQHVH